MNITKLKGLSKSEIKRLTIRSSGSNDAILQSVSDIFLNVKRGGDKVILDKYRTRFGSDAFRSLRVEDDEIRQAYREVSKETVRALRQMKRNIMKFSRAQLPRKTEKRVITDTGISVWRQWRPIEKVGLYIPGGKATYPSSVLMTGIPALVAGSREIVMCSPPKKTGTISAATLVAADMIGIRNIYKVGGVEAVAAMTFGTESIPSVDKIFGAGNSFVTAAKSLAQKTIAIDMPAGPSEVFIIADETADPAFIAADLLADGEHGEDSACVLVTTSEDIAKKTIGEIEKQAVELSTGNRALAALKRYGLICLADSLGEAVEFSNEYAPEHLMIMTKNPEGLVGGITNAGSVFLGSYTTKSSGDYATGANHVLPTGGGAKMYPPLGVDCYGKWMQVQKCTKRGLKNIRETIETIARVEELPAHGQSTSIRFRK